VRARLFAARQGVGLATSASNKAGGIGEGGRDGKASGRGEGLL